MLAIRNNYTHGPIGIITDEETEGRKGSEVSLWPHRAKIMDMDISDFIAHTFDFPIALCWKGSERLFQSNLLMIQMGKRRPQ